MGLGFVNLRRTNHERVDLIFLRLVAQIDFFSPVVTMHSIDFDQGGLKVFPPLRFPKIPSFPAQTFSPYARGICKLFCPAFVAISNKSLVPVPKPAFYREL